MRIEGWGAYVIAFESCILKLPEVFQLFEPLLEDILLGRTLIDELECQTLHTNLAMCFSH